MFVGTRQIEKKELVGFDVVTETVEVQLFLEKDKQTLQVYLKEELILEVPLTTQDIAGEIAKAVANHD